MQFFAEQLYRLAETLKVYDFPFPQEFNYIIHIRVIAETKNIVIGYACFLFWCVHFYTTRYYRYFENKRFASTDFDLIHFHKNHKIVCGQAIHTEKHGIRLG